jgi:hypothetical protein
MLAGARIKNPLTALGIHLQLLEERLAEGLIAQRD